MVIESFGGGTDLTHIDGAQRGGVYQFVGHFFTASARDVAKGDGGWFFQAVHTQQVGPISVYWKMGHFTGASFFRDEGDLHRLRDPSLGGMIFRTWQNSTIHSGIDGVENSRTMRL